MDTHRGRRTRRARAVGVGVALTLAVAGCSWTTVDDSASGGMRPVPTVPTVPAPGEEVVVETAAVPVPVTTEVVGDPRPDPDSAETLPPLPEMPEFDTCVRLADHEVAERFGTATGVGIATAESIVDGGCRFSAGGGVVEVHYLSEDLLESDWFRRDGIEPVGDVIADAVGIAAFTSPSSDEGVGYTIALVSRRQGAVIA